MSKVIFIPSFPVTFPLLCPCTLCIPKQRKYLSLSAAPHSPVIDGGLCSLGGGHTGMGKPKPFPSGKAFVAVQGMCDP